jgi:hypothetical protein
MTLILGPSCLLLANLGTIGMDDRSKKSSSSYEVDFFHQDFSNHAHNLGPQHAHPCAIAPRHTQPSSYERGGVPGGKSHTTVIGNATVISYPADRSTHELVALNALQRTSWHASLPWTGTCTRWRYRSPFCESILYTYGIFALSPPPTGCIASWRHLSPVNSGF